MSALRALTSGAIGACCLTAAHELLRSTVTGAPRVDVLGERAIAATMEAAGVDAPPETSLYPAALAGDLVSNGLYYAGVGLAGKEAAPVVGAVLGLAAGVGAVTLPEPLGLGKRPTGRSAKTMALTVGLYVLGGVVAGLAYRGAGRAK